MSSTRTAPGRAGSGWAVRCDRCGLISGELAASARAALAASRELGWDRPRPGVDDLCPGCRAAG